MKKIIGKLKSWSFEGLALLTLVVLLAGVLAAGWGSAMKLRQTIADNAAIMDIDPSPLIEVEKLRRLAEAEIDGSRAYFLMGSKSIFEKLEEDQKAFEEKIAAFEQQYSLPQIPEIIQRIQTLRKQEQEYFDQGIKFREEKTESKIVGQFYNAKTAPIRKELNERFDEIAKLHSAELDQARERARQAGLDAQAIIPKEMTWFTSAIAGLFFCLAVLVLRMMARRKGYLRERERLVEAAKKAVLARDEVISAVSFDFKEPLTGLNMIAENLSKAKDLKEVADHADFIKGSVIEIQSIIDDIYDQKKADLGDLTLRLDQLPVADILEEVQFALHPVAKKNDINLHVETLSPSILAFADRERVLRVIFNIVNNAIKFGRKHTKISIKAKSDPQFVYISVADGGPGIPKDRLDTIFDDFWQARETAHLGAGVGLAVVKSIITAHGGTVTAESNLNGGTTITFSLPRRRPVGVPLRKPSSKTARRDSFAQAAQSPDAPGL